MPQKRCPEGYHLSQPRCVKDQPVKRTSRRGLSQQEARRIIEILQELKPNVMATSRNEEPYASTTRLDERLHEDTMRLLHDLDTEELSQAHFRTPMFFLYVFPRLSDPQFRAEYADPGDRYDVLRNKFMEKARVSMVSPAYKYSILKTYLVMFAPKSFRESLETS